ncbi:MAG: HDOD domain-containing protein [Methylococcales bacterium]|nr:HDOD domain-containing protein [Methylococcales bacterium]
MKEWLNTLLKREKKTSENVSIILENAVTSPLSPKKNHPLKVGLHCTPPIGQKKTHQPLDVLQKFTPFNDLDKDYQDKLLHKTLRYSAGSVVFLHGSVADAVYYLLNGSIELHPDTDDNYDLSIPAQTLPPASYEITADTGLAYLPLNSAKVFGATAIAKTTVDIMTITHDVAQLWTQYTEEKAKQGTLIDIKLPMNLNQNQFFIRFAQAYHKNTLQLPSLPTVAIKLRNAMQEDDISIREAVDIIQIDPAIMTKLIQVANSALYAPMNPIKNCHDAVTRLGLNATRSLVIGINLKQLFHCNNKQILIQMQNAWKQSLLVSSLCFVLAEEVTGINPEEALLAGLINDIGIIPLLHFAEQHPDEQLNFQQVMDTIPYLRAPVGRMVLNTLGFSEELTEIPYDAENWFHDSGETIQLIDIVILAKWHSYIGTEKAKELPYINSIPAYSKLNNGKLSPDFSLAVLQKAKQRINAAMSVLS